MSQRSVPRAITVFIIMITLTGCTGEHRRTNERSPSPADDWDAFVGRLPRGTNPDAMLNAFSLAENLAMVHLMLPMSSDSQVKSIVGVFSKAAQQDAAKLRVQLPADSLTDSFDPRVADEIGRIASANGRMTALCFEFSYHAHQAMYLAPRLSRILKSNTASPSDGFLELGLRVHMDQALNAAISAHFPSETIQEGKTLAAGLEEIRRKVPTADRAAAYEDVGNRLASWHRHVRVPLEIRLRLRLTSKRKEGAA